MNLLAASEELDRFRFFSAIPAMPQAKRQLIIWAYAIAKEWHRRQDRDDGVRYFEHLRGVAVILILLGYTDAESLAVAILHDVLEDPFMSISLLEQIFGAIITRDVISVSKSYCLEDPLTGFLTRVQRTPEQYHLSVSCGTVRAIIVKLADRQYNLTDLSGDNPPERWTPEKRLRQVEETRRFHLPLAEQHEPRIAERLRHLCDVIEFKAKAELAASQPPP